MNMNIFYKSVICGSLLFAATGVQAIQLEPGKWEMQFDGFNPMNGSQMSRKTIECIAEREHDPVQLAGMADGMCDVSNLQERGNTVTWHMTCGGAAGAGMPMMQGDGHFVSQGRAAKGELNMTLSFGGMEMQQQSRWQGRFIAAACD
ncbi:MAG TPA: DUF3617 family protein [Gammaproteobacteria bacterium]|nr:DUF3617 family protein [Gammaproteobacteria bacterium]